ncbi:MAG: hypothetical protein SF053_02190 [Bacteroidia bacterium]|nr:hypothetical protein [Bacteroidia bacterium]
MKKLQLVSGLAVVLLVSNLILAGILLYRGTQSVPSHPPDRRQVIITQLKLDSEQVRAYDQLIASHRQQIQGLQHDIKDLKTQLYASLAVPGASPADTLIAHIGAQQQAIERVHYEHFREIGNLCRPDQRAGFEALVVQLSDLFGPPPGPPPGGPPPRPVP